MERLVSLARADGATRLEIWFATSQILILVAFMFSFVLAMTAAFLGAPAIAADVESGVAHAMLAGPSPRRPRRRPLARPRRRGRRLRDRFGDARDRRDRLRHRLPARRSRGSPSASWQRRPSSSCRSACCSPRLPAIAAGAICVVLFGLGWMAGVFAGDRPVLRRRAARCSSGDEPLAAPDRRPLARHDLWPRAAGLRPDRARARRAGHRGQSVLRRVATAGGVPGLVGCVDRDRARSRRRVAVRRDL